MKKYLTNKLKLIGAVLVTAVIGLVLTAPLARASQPFNTTNYIAASTTITSWPTNTIGTNSQPVLTGGVIGLQNQRHVMLVMQGIPLVTNATTLSVTLVRSGADGPPQVSAARNDFDTVNQPAFSFTVQNSLSPFCFTTNLDEYTVGDANYIGVYSITPGTGSGVTNLVVGLSKKIIPIRYP